MLSFTANYLKGVFLFLLLCFAFMDPKSPGSILYKGSLKHSSKETCAEVSSFSLQLYQETASSTGASL